MDVRWKQAPDPKSQSQARHSRKNSSTSTRRSMKPAEKSPSRAVISVEMESNGASLSPPNAIGDLMNLTFLEPETSPSSISLPTPHSLGFIIQGFDQDPSLSQDELPSSATAPTYPPDIFAQPDCTDFSPELWNMESFWEDYLRPTGNTPPALGLEENGQHLVSETSKSRDDEADRIAHLFHEQTCHTLSIQEESEQNPWSTLIWPLAKQYPALWHAIAALTCFCMSKKQPQLRVDGVRHVQRSAQLLSDHGDNIKIPLNAALAATLALGFAETWDYENSSIGTSHIRSAGILLSQILSDHPNRQWTSEEEARIEFLYNTWTYMDVLARFTYSEQLPTYSTGAPVPHWDELGWDTSRLDPLMGYATTLFPIMRRVADLIHKVRAKPTPRNSPAIISQSLSLARLIEAWTPPIDLEAVDDPNPNMTDAIQTAEAYRWATLALLYQAVPELPNLTSYGELAQRILIYLATIPLNSTTVIVHILPLMVAGCDAVDPEDRDFVRERWRAMARRMVTSITDRCLNITEEVWKRREAYLTERGLMAADINHAVVSEIAALNSDGEAQRGMRRRMHDFPISAAFKRGVDPLTRSGCSEYTVRGRLHWLGVMRDWELQVMLG